MGINASVPTSLKIDDMELASIYANAVENAIKGCEAAPLGTERSIKIYTSYRDGKLILQVKNSCDPSVISFDIMGMPISPREGGGVGTRSIRYVVEKHGGTWYFDIKGDIFITSVVIAGV